MSKCPVHKMLSKLATFAGLPVPFMVKWHDGKPDFRVIDGPMVIRCVEEKLCGICGQKLGPTAWWIGGPLTLKHQLFVDPPMHKTCALESMRLCPYLNGKKPVSRMGGFHQDVYVHENVVNTRPDKMYLSFGWTKNMKFSDRASGIDSGRIAVEREF